ncbi:HNH endonuclease [Salmonella enterica]|nr:HNH endonuclease [Salmonella enterica]
MPPRTPRACRKHGCARTTTDRSGYCEQHRGTGWESQRAGRTNKQRGYGYTWTLLRERIMQRDNFICQPCRQQGIATPATAVDHIKPKAHGGTDDDSNLQAICEACHRMKTARERKNTR